MIEHVCDHDFVFSTQFSIPLVEIKRCTKCGICEKTVLVSKSSWTTEKPTKAGWYWYRGDDRSEPVIRQVVKRRALYVVVPGPDGEEDELLKYHPGEWAGPLEQPPA